MINTFCILCLLDINNMNEFNLVNSFSAGNNIIKKLNDIGSSHKHIKFWKHVTSDEFIFQCNSEETIFLLTSTIETQLEITVSVGALYSSRAPNPNNIDSITISILKAALLQAKLNNKHKVCIYEICTD